MWRGSIDDRCLSCGGFLEPRRFSQEVENKINRQLKKEEDYFVLKPGDTAPVRMMKAFGNTLRWGAYYLQLALFAFVTFMLLLLSLFAA